MIRAARSPALTKGVLGFARVMKHYGHHIFLQRRDACLLNLVVARCKHTATHATAMAAAGGAPFPIITLRRAVEAHCRLVTALELSASEDQPLRRICGVPRVSAGCSRAFRCRSPRRMGHLKLNTIHPYAGMLPPTGNTLLEEMARRAARGSPQRCPKQARHNRVCSSVGRF